MRQRGICSGTIFFRASSDRPPARWLRAGFFLTQAGGAVDPKLGPIVRQPLSQAALLQHGRKALHRRCPTLLRRLHRAISRRSDDQLSAREPYLGLALHLWRTEELRARQSLHGLPPQWSAGGLADQDEILPLITAISWRTYETLAHNECWRERARLPWRRFAKSWRRE